MVNDCVQSRKIRVKKEVEVAHVNATVCEGYRAIQDGILYLSDLLKTSAVGMRVERQYGHGCATNVLCHIWPYLMVSSRKSADVPAAYRFRDCSAIFRVLLDLYLL